MSSARRNLIAFSSGVLFAVGLAIGGMTRPVKVLGFLDFAGAWDPSLALVMGGAVAVHAAALLWARRLRAPVAAPAFVPPVTRGVDARLLAGASLFGAGWGLAGYCPGPAVASLLRLQPATLAFAASMAAGMLLQGALRRARAGSAAAGSAAAVSVAPECSPDAPADAA
jgi:uncharacterized membrane protein YedE/YeeE